jgi:nucleoside-diphosphate-sugar epimerase
MEVVFAPFFQMIDLDKATVAFFGDENTSLDVTTTGDTARFTAAAALEPSAIPGPFGIVGDRVTPASLAALLTEVKGKPFRLVRRGSIADLESWIASEQEAGRAMEWPTIGAQYAWAMMSGKARITDPVNARYPDIVTTSAAKFLRSFSGTHS